MKKLFLHYQSFQNIKSMTDREFMNRAIGLSVDNVANGGGPFGAVIVRNGEIIA